MGSPFGTRIAQEQDTRISKKELRLLIPNILNRQSRWSDFRKPMMESQLRMLNPILADLDRLRDSIRYEILGKKPSKTRFAISISAIVERSLIGFLETQAYTRAFLSVRPGSESDVLRLYRWWRDLWGQVDFKRLPESQTKETLPKILSEAQPPAVVLLRFANMENHRRYQDLCSVWLVMAWMKMNAPNWLARIGPELAPFKISRKFNTLMSQDLLAILHDLGLPRLDDRRGHSKPKATRSSSSDDRPQESQD